jgi:N6-adenosine-specific RNA methylase IME4
MDLKKYSVILADPAWLFRVWNHESGIAKSPEKHYNVMDDKAICDLPIKQLSESNSVLFIWTIYPKLFDTEKIIKAWGFKYKTLGFEWLKLNKKWAESLYKIMPPMFAPGIGKPADYDLLQKLFFLGLGYYTRANPEPCLLATRGSMPVAVHNERNIIIAPIREHSRKPDEQYTKIENLYPAGNRLELFARHARPGWDHWGNQAENSIDLTPYYELQKAERSRAGTV